MLDVEVAAVRERPPAAVLGDGRLGHSSELKRGGTTTPEGVARVEERVVQEHSADPPTHAADEGQIRQRRRRGRRSEEEGMAGALESGRHEA